MGVYFARRFLLMIPTFIGITILVFSITRIVPGGPIEQMIARAQQGGAEAGGGGTAMARIGSVTVAEFRSGGVSVTRKPDPKKPEAPKAEAEKAKSKAS